MRPWTNNKSVLLIFFAGVLWGSIGVFVNELTRVGSGAEMTSFLRFFTGAVMLFIFNLLRGRGFSIFRVSRKSFFTCMLLGLICHGCCGFCYSLAVTHIGMSGAVVLLYVAPVFTFIFSMIIFKEKASVRKLAAILINITGCVLTVTNGVFDIKTLVISGILFGIGSGVCYALTAIIGRLASADADPYVVTMYSFFAAAALMLIFMRPWDTGFYITGEMFFWGCLFGFFPSALAYGIYFSGVRTIKESSRVPVIASIEVVVATLFGVILYSEELGPVSIGGIVLVLFSILIMNFKKKAKA